jgi:hypothetical protein
LRQTKRFVRYSKIKETEAELLIYFCQELIAMKPSIKSNKVLTNMYNKQLEMAMRAINKLHEDLQFDYEMRLQDLTQL